MTRADVAALQALELRAMGCTACRLRPGCTGVIVSDGDPAAPLMIVGEAPGGEEDRLGRPFVGQAGQLLDRILAAAGLTRQDAYLTSVVKCRPPGDRTPGVDEIEVCTELWLKAQLALLRPRVILTLGNTATQFLLGTQLGITRLRGTWHPYHHRDEQGGSSGALLMPLFHPAYLLHHDSRAPGSPKSLTWRDIREAAAVLRGEKEPEGWASAVPPPAGGQPTLF